MNKKGKLLSKPSQAPEKGNAGHFSFSARRYAARHSLRLFTPQKALISPAFELDAPRPHAILRVVSSCA
ncbi:hypothetical protein SBV1_3240012 [Verrucomicrobia bacterium]|nr:hypothetical protein SBV1_3240012 [Verrucomicrobiota bacterium]